MTVEAQSPPPSAAPRPPTETVTDARRVLEPSLRAVAQRVRLQRGMETAATVAVASAGVSGPVVALAATGQLGPAATMGWLVGLALTPFLIGFAAAVRPLSRLQAAHRLDRAGGHAGRTAAAVDLLRTGTTAPFAIAAIADAAQRPLSPPDASPVRAPADLPPALALLAAVLLLAGVLEVPPPAPPAGPAPPGLEALLLHPDDLAGQRAELDEILAATEDGSEADDDARALNAILEDLADRRIDREEALRRLGELEGRLTTPTPGLEGVSRAMESLGAALARAGVRRPDDRDDGVNRPLGDLRASLEAAEAARGERALDDLADALEGTAPSRSEIDRIRRALAAAADRDPAAEQDASLERQRSLLDREDPPGGLTNRERRLLQRQRRELERLERSAMTTEQRRTLERLRRELDRGAEDLRRDPASRAAQDALRRAAEELHRYAQEQLSEEQRRQLERQVRQLRELLRRHRQQQPGGEGSQPTGGQGRRRDRFVLRAGGQDGESIPLLVPGQDGSQGQGGGGGEGQSAGEGQPGPRQGGAGQGGAAGGGTSGSGDRDGDGRPDALVLGGEGEGSAELLMPGMGEGSGQGTGESGGGAAEGPGAGDGHDPTQLDDPTQLGGRQRTVQVAGEVGEGPNRSQVIRGAAAEGFAGRGYRRVYDDYRDHAEAVIESEEVPDGYRFYVRRYFQLIRPRPPGGDEE